MTRKQAIEWLKYKGFKDEMIGGGLCAYYHMMEQLRVNRFPLKDVVDLVLSEDGEIICIFETGMGHACGYGLKNESLYDYETLYDYESL